MENHNVIKSEIDQTDRYKELVNLREKIWGLSGKFPFSVYVDLRGKVEDKINRMDYPTCDKINLQIIFPDRPSIALDTNECKTALSKGLKLSEYIFSRYPNATDYQIDSTKIYGSYEKSSSEQEELKPDEQKFSGGPELQVLQDRVEYMIRLMNYMSRVYADSIPKIAKDIKDINVKFELIYKKLRGEEEEEL